MSTAELRKKLIDKIQNIDDDRLLREAYRLLELETTDLEVYKLSDEQRSAVGDAKEQIKNGQFLTNDQSNRAIDEWLNE